MSDARYDVYQHYGTAAERAGFTPDPPVLTGVQPIYIWYETDTDKTWVYHTTWEQISGTGIYPPIDATYLTEDDETAVLTGSRQLLAGTGISFDDATPGERTINNTGGDVTGPASSTDEAVALFNGTTGKTIKNSVVVVSTTGAVTGPVSIAVGGTLVTNTKLTVEGQVNIKPSNHSAAGTTETIDFAVSNEHTVILDENVTLTLSNPVDGGRYVIILIQDSSGGNTVTWPATVRWPSGVTPTITSGANRADLVTLYYISSLTIYLGSINQDYTTT